MAQYFIQGSDGKFYGPADEATLDRWALEGRILADSILVEQGTNRQISARDFTLLQKHFQYTPRITTPPPALQPRQHQPYPQQPFQQQPFQQQPYQQQYQNPPQPTSYPRPGQLPYGYSRKNKVIAGILALVFGIIGIHQFYLGYNQKGITMILVTCIGYFACGLGPIITTAWSIYDAVMIFMGRMPDAQGLPLE